jgi:hypothetical protein
MSMFDLNLISLYRINGQEWPLLPGLLALNPPRKTARGREQDRLLVYLTLAGNVMYSSSEYAEITAQVAERFYNTSGSLTFALKTAVESLNAYLVERNIKTKDQGQYNLGALVLAALRGNSFYIVQSGPTHAYWLARGETRHFHDAALAGKGLGLSQKAHMYFAQAALNSGDRVLFCAALPPNWDKSLAEERNPTSLEFMRRRLLAITDTNVSAVLFQAVDGSGAMNILRPSKEGPLEAGQAAEARPAGQPVSTNPSPPAVPPVKQASVESSAASSQPAVVSKQPPAPNRQPLTENFRSPARTSPSSTKSATGQAYSPEPKVLITPEQREKLKKGMQGGARFLAQSIQNGRALSKKALGAIEKLIPRLMPGEQDTTPASLPGSWLAIVALAMPLMVVTMAVVVYLNFGIPEQYNIAYQNARNEVSQTQNEQNPTKLRTHWNAVLDFLNEAEQYNVTEDSKSLRVQAQNALDTLDRVVRVNYRLAFDTPLNRSVRVTHMAASDVDIYVLDNTSGSVIRGSLNGRSYDLDPTYECKPGSYNGLNVGPLIDMVALPRSNPSGASVVGIDAAGNLLYCATGEDPKASALKMPDVGWNQITAIAYDSNNLYVLDAPARAVWVFFGTADIQFPEKPFFFFESQVPTKLEEATGMAVNGDDLYLLYKDNHLTTCTLSRIDASPTRCTDPAVFIDTRPGHESGITLPDGVFSQITFTSAPDPAVALLEPYTQSIFRFSGRALELQNQIQPLAGKDNPLPAGAEITAMAFSPNKVLFIFIGGQVYFTVNIP